MRIKLGKIKLKKTMGKVNNIRLPGYKALTS